MTEEKEESAFEIIVKNCRLTIRGLVDLINLLLKDNVEITLGNAKKLINISNNLTNIGIVKLCKNKGDVFFEYP